MDLFTELRSSKANKQVISHLENLVAKGSDFECYKINAFRLADELHVSHREALRTLLFATRLGIFDLNYDIHCPSCMGIPAYSKHLMGLEETAHCPLCTIDWSLDLEEQVEVTFTVNPELRQIEIKDFAERDFEGQQELVSSMLEREGRALKLGLGLFPGQEANGEMELKKGDFTYYVPAEDHAGQLVVTGEETAEAQTFSIVAHADGSFSPASISARPGKIKLVVSTEYDRVVGLAVRTQGPKNNWVSAAHVIAQQDFRDLFGSEYLAPDLSFAIRSVTLMFTDITASTEMYERLGDGPAYALVQDHFSVMTEVIAQHEGGIVKTIGDAVMAAFPRTIDGLSAACEIQQAFTERSDNLAGVTVKIGVHRGPAIVVTSNRATDYFGRTVNLAARVQGEAEASQVVVGPAVIEDKKSADYLAEMGYKLDVCTRSLKGIEEPVALTVISF